MAVDRYELSTLDEIEERFRALIVDADLPEPDDVRKDTNTGELTFRWHEHQLEVVVGPDDLELGGPIEELQGSNGAG